MIKDNYIDINKIIQDKKIMRLFLTVKAHGGALRFVGGCVRDTILGANDFDIDLATDLSPDELAEACDEEGLITKPIGISHGTIGVIINGQMLEVTSLRKDVKTDGRHAVVEYTDDWSVDASRRDLTMNAVYADEKGTVFDYYNGLEDIENGVVRFIGNPDARIKEDYIRIIRFFRFYGNYGKTPIDKKALEACIANKDGLKKISSERIFAEIKKVVMSKKPAKTMELLFEHKILDAIMPEPKNYNLLKIFKKYSEDPLARLFCLYLPDEKLANNLAFILKMSNKGKEKFVNLAKNKIDVKVFLCDESLYKTLYYLGKDLVLTNLFLNIAQNKIDENSKDEIVKKIKNFEMPEFELKGGDVIKAGVPQGVEVKKTLDKLEKIWVDSNFSISKDDLLINL